MIKKNGIRANAIYSKISKGKDRHDDLGRRDNKENEKILKARFKQKINTAENWKKAGDNGFIPLDGEIIYYRDAKGADGKVYCKVGDGVTNINNLPFYENIGGGAYFRGSVRLPGYGMGTGVKINNIWIQYPPSEKDKIRNLQGHTTESGWDASHDCDIDYNIKYSVNALEAKGEELSDSVRVTLNGTYYEYNNGAVAGENPYVAHTLDNQTYDAVYLDNETFKQTVDEWVGEQYNVFYYTLVDETATKEYVDAMINQGGDFAQHVNQVLIPTEKVVIVSNGKRRVKEKNRYAGYVFVEAELVGEVQPLLRNVPNVLGFLSDTKKNTTPMPLRPSEVSQMLGTIDEMAEVPEDVIIPFEVGENVKVTEGPFSGFDATIEDVNNEKKKLKVTFYLEVCLK